MENKSRNRLKQTRRLEQKARQANEALDKAQHKLSHKKRLVRKSIYMEEKQKTATRLRFESTKLPDQIPKGRNYFHAIESISQRAGMELDHELHKKIQETEDENLGLKAAHHTEITAETVIREVSDSVGTLSRKPMDKASSARLKAERANTRLLMHRSLQEESSLNHFQLAKAYQKREIKRRYAHAYRMTRSGTQAAAATTIQAAPGALKIATLERKAKLLIRKHSGFIILAASFGVFAYLMLSGIFLLGSAVQEAGSSLVGSTYLSSDTDILSADEAYADLEDRLQEQINRIPDTYPGYDEYQYQIDEISHDPYVLTSYLNARYGNYRYAQITNDLNVLFSEQYRLHIWDDVEIRTRIVEYTYVDPETGEEVTESYEEEYEVTILHAQLTNRGLEIVASENLNSNQMINFQACNATLGNRSYLFGENILIGNPSQGGLDYQVPSESLEDSVFAALLSEGEKYLGYAYVWGGSSPETSFDCSGFISWIINSTGVADVGRSTANGLWNTCDQVSASQARPGDLVFFEGTYDTVGASHVGLYVGNGVMLHAGNPIQYTSIETSYWQQHLLGFGRIY